MNLLDLLLVVLAAGALGNGYRRGLSLAAFSYGGLIAGTALGAFLAPLAGKAVGANAGVSPLLGLGMLLLAASIGSSVGYAFGEPLRMRLLRSPSGGRADSVVGAAFSATAVVATAWFLGLAFTGGPIPFVSREVQGSAIIRAVDSVFPRPPRFLVGVEQMLRNVPYPQVFDRIGNPDDLPGPVRIDTAIAGDPAVVASARETVKVRSLGCGGEVFGTAFPVAANYLVSNAHVVAGTHEHRVIVPDGRVLSATVVLFDPERDISILYVRGLKLAPLADGFGQRGTTGATIGYPGGGDETVSAAAIRGQVQAVGRDIYGQAEVERQIFVLTADIHPGNSGGPLVDDHGRVMGVVFANSTTDPSEGYALTDAEVAPDVNAGVGRTAGVSTQACAG